MNRQRCCAAVPQVGGGPGGVAGDRDHLEVVALHVAREKVPATLAVSATASRSLSWQNSGALERRGDPVGAAERGLVPVVQVVARDAAELLDRAGVVGDGGGAVDEQVALRASQQKGADCESKARTTAPAGAEA